jgi:hypothetical protein
MIIKSQIYLSEEWQNQQRKSKNEAELFYPAEVFSKEQKSLGFALLTQTEIARSMKRASKNFEDTKHFETTSGIEIQGEIQEFTPSEETPWLLWSSIVMNFVLLALLAYSRLF